MKAAQLNLAKASERMKAALEHSGILERPLLTRISTVNLRFLGRACGLPQH
jgi:hypothetical protein